MARTLKTRGVQEIGALRRRVRRQHAMDRISTVDCDTLVTALDRMEAYIVAMYEAPTDNDIQM